MSKVEELLEKYNPDGVEDLTLGEICLNHDSKRRPISKGNRIPGNIPYYGANGIQDYVDDYLFNGEYILVGEDGSVITEEGTPIVKWVYGKFWVNNHAHIFSENLNKALLKYVFYILQINKIKDLVRGVPPKLTKESALSISLKIPHIKVQEEIVKILDSFTNLIDALNEELSLRQKQFEYYREKLLTFDDNVYTMSLGDCCVIKGRIGFRGYTIKDQVNKGEGAISLSPGNISEGIINYNQCTYISWDKYYESPEIMINNGDIIFCKTASVGKVAVINDLPSEATINPQLVVLKEININKKYLYYYLSSNSIQNKVKSLAGVGSVPNISQSILNDLDISVPSSQVMKSIVEKLDAFESLISSLKEEIALRQKQYEYYREKLLTFD